MTDERIEAELAAYVDDALPPDRAAAVERHLAGSDRYRVMVAEMRRARAWLGSLPTVAPPGGRGAADDADPTIARLERDALFGDALFGQDESRDAGPPAPLPMDPWRHRLTSPAVLGVAATLAVLGTIAVATLLLLPGGPADDLALRTEQTPTPAPAYPVEPDPANPTAPEPPPAGATGVPDVPPRPDVADPPPEEPVPPPPPLPDLPDLGGAPILLVAEADDPAVAVALATAALGGREAVVRPDAAAELPVSVLELLAHDARVADAFDDAGGLAGRRHVVVASARGLARPAVARLMDDLGADARPLAAFVEPPPQAVVGPRFRRVDPIGGVRFDRPPRLTAAERAAARRQRALDRRRRAAESSDAATPLVFPNDRLRLTLRRTSDLPPDAPPALARLLADADAANAVDLAVDADGYLDLAPLALPTMDALGLSPPDVAGEVARQLAFEHLVGVSASAVTTGRAEVPGGRLAPVLADLKLDRRPFAPGDLVRVHLAGDLRLEALVADDGRVELGDLGPFDAAGRTAGQLQPEIAARLADPALAALRPDPDAGPPAVANVTSRRAADAEDPADADRVPVAVVLLLRDPPPAPTTATTATTAPADDWQID